MKIKIGLSIASFLLIPALLFAGTATVGRVGKQDLKLWDGASQKTFERKSRYGGYDVLNKIGHTVDALSVYGGGTEYTGATIANTFSNIGETAKVGVELAPGTWIISTARDFSSYTNIALIIPDGAQIRCDADLTLGGPIIAGQGAFSDNGGTANLTINGPFEVGTYQVFDWTGSGTVSFSAGTIGHVPPEWWGAVAGDGNDDTSAMDAAITAAAGKAKVKLQCGQYNLTSLTTDTLFHIEGIMQGNVADMRSDTFNFTTLTFSEASGVAWTFYNAAGFKKGCILEAIGIDTNTSGISMLFTDIPNLKIQDCFLNVKGDGAGAKFVDSYITTIINTYFMEEDEDRTATKGVEIVNTSGGGEYTFLHSNIRGFTNGLYLGEASATPAGTLQTVNFISSQVKSAQIGISVFGGCEVVNILRSYIEGATSTGITIQWNPTTVNILGNFFNNPGNSAKSIQVGQGGGVAAQQQFYNVYIAENYISNIADTSGIGIQVTANTTAELLVIENNDFQPETGGQGTGIELSGAAVAQVRNARFGNLAVDINNYALVKYPNYNHGGNVETITGTKTLTADSDKVQALNNNAGSGQKVLLPPEAESYGKEFIIVETGGNNDLVVKDDSDTTTICRVSINRSGVFYCDGTTWYEATHFITDNTAAGAGADGTISSRNANPLGECDGFAELKNEIGTVIYVPYWLDITP